MTVKLDALFPELEPPPGGLFRLKTNIQRDLVQRRRRFLWGLGLATAAILALVWWPKPKLETPRLLDDSEMRALGIGQTPERVHLEMGKAVKTHETDTVVVYSLLVPRQQDDRVVVTNEQDVDGDRP